MKPMGNIDLAIKYVHQKYGDKFRAYLLPSGNTVVPQIKEK